MALPSSGLPRAVQYDDLKVVLKEAGKSGTLWLNGRGKDWHEVGPTPAGAAERSRMWILVMILLNTVPGLDKIIKLETYATAQECQSERNRIGYEMAAAYPNDRDFVIACQLSRKHES